MFDGLINKVYAERCASRGDDAIGIIKEGYVANLLNDNYAFFEEKFPTQETDLLKKIRRLHEIVFGIFSNMLNYLGSSETSRLLSEEQNAELMPERKLGWIKYVPLNNRSLAIDYTDSGIEIMNNYFRLIGEKSVQERRDEPVSQICGKNLEYLFN